MEINDSVKVTVPAIDPWFKTGILLKSAGIYRIEARPPDQIWKDGNILKPFTADGRNNIMTPLGFLLRLPSAKWFSLIGCINKKRNSYFKIGSLCENYSPPEDGELICFANDVIGFYHHNNEGEITIIVRRTG